ncbi:unnamed protein product [Cylindrotheca closterium]|uniref:Uncharacterized protein n=1 Tax=Cylindrotheca closterium TaxID=2856 RepID=A0AAD2CLX4_9STRA|nr:unnamed protein product [Cylindrotheca closterium]
MDQLVRDVSNRLNVDEDVAQTALGAILKFIKKNYVTDEGSLDFEQILEHLKGAGKLLQKEEAREEKSIPPPQATNTTSDAKSSTATTGGTSSIVGMIIQVLKLLGILTMLKTFLEPIFGESVTRMIDSVEEGAELTAVFRDLKIDRDQGITILNMLWTTMQEKLDQKTLERIMSSIPALQTLLDTIKNKKDE